MASRGSLLLHLEEGQWQVSWLSRCPSCENASPAGAQGAIAGEVYGEEAVINTDILAGGFDGGEGDAEFEGGGEGEGEYVSDYDDYDSDFYCDEENYLESELLDREEEYEAKAHTKNSRGCGGAKSSDIKVSKGRGQRKGMVSRRDKAKLERSKLNATEAAFAKQARREVRIAAHASGVGYKLESKKPNEYSLAWSTPSLWQNYPRPSHPTQRIQQAFADELGLDLATYRLLIEMQEREITPEDYDVLLNVHSAANKPETLTVDTLELIPVLRVRTSGSDVTPGLVIVEADTTCLVCLGDFTDGEQVRQLPCPCKHVFHKSCIDTFLSEHGSFCPIDRSSLL